MPHCGAHWRPTGAVSQRLTARARGQSRGRPLLRHKATCVQSRTSDTSTARVLTRVPKSQKTESSPGRDGITGEGITDRPGWGPAPEMGSATRVGTRNMHSHGTFHVALRSSGGTFYIFLSFFFLFCCGLTKEPDQRGSPAQQEPSDGSKRSSRHAPRPQCEALRHRRGGAAAPAHTRGPAATIGEATLLSRFQTGHTSSGQALGSNLQTHKPG